MNVVETLYNERYICCCIFFQEKLLSFTCLKFDFFLGFGFWFLFKLSSSPLVKGKQVPLSNNKIIKVKKMRPLSTSKVSFNFQIPQRNKNFYLMIQFSQ